MTAQGRSTRSIYKGWAHGDVIPDSVLVTDLDDFKMAWDLYGHKFAIVVQNDEDMAVHADIATFIYNWSKNHKDVILLYVDEMMDHFREGGAPIAKAGTIWGRIARSGRELGIGILFGAQRSKRMSISLIEELKFLFLFRLDYEEDVDRLRAMGLPRSVVMPTQDHVFVYWNKRQRTKIWGPFKLRLP